LVVCGASVAGLTLRTTTVALPWLPWASTAVTTIVCVPTGSFFAPCQVSETPRERLSGRPPLVKLRISLPAPLTAKVMRMMSLSVDVARIVSGSLVPMIVLGCGERIWTVGAPKSPHWLVSRSPLRA
jgi:hypothetical protein